jgi:hypothetical protein
MINWKLEKFKLRTEKFKEFLTFKKVLNKKLLFSLILLFSFEANANLHSLWNFPKEWTDKLLKECEPTFIEEYKEFPKEYHALKAPERVFYCVYMLEEAGYDMSESDNWFRHAKMKNQFEYEYEELLEKYLTNITYFQNGVAQEQIGYKKELEKN